MPLMTLKQRTGIEIYALRILRLPLSYESQMARLEMETSVTKAGTGNLDTGVNDGDGKK